MRPHEPRGWSRSIRGLPLGLMAAALAASCSNNDQLIAPATQLGVYGTVETENHVPASGALVRLASARDPNTSLVIEQSSDNVRTIPNGGFGIAPEPAGRYVLLAGYARAASTSGGAFDSLVAYSIVTVSSPTAYRVPERLTLRPPAIVMGRVIMSTPGLRFVDVVGMGGPVSGSIVDWRGDFVIEGVPQGTWWIQVSDGSGTAIAPVVTVPGITTRFGEITHIRDIQFPSP